MVITDYKTGRPLSQEDADESLQLSIYALAAHEKWGYRADHLAFYNLSENTSVLTYRNDTQLQAAKAKVEEVAGNIAAGKFDAKPSFSCRFCAYRVVVPRNRKTPFPKPREFIVTIPLEVPLAQKLRGRCPRPLCFCLD